MKIKQSILEDYSEIENITARDISHPHQKYIHFWDFMDLDDSVYEFQAKMGSAINDLKDDMQKRYRSYYTHTMIQTPEKFTRHNQELQEIEYLLENPFFLALVHSALTKSIDETKLRTLSISYKKKLMEKRMSIKEDLEKDIKKGNDLLIR
jgi:hypothetical protein